MRNKIRKENLKTAIAVVLLALAAIVLIEVVDKKASNEIEKYYAAKDSMPEKNARKYVPVEYAQFVTLIESYHATHNAVLNIGDVYVSEDGLTCFSITGSQYLLTGKHTSTEWCSDTMCSFATEKVNDSVVVVSCPADLLARLVEDYESLN